MLISFAVLSFAATVFAMALSRGAVHLDEPRREDDDAHDGDGDVLLPVVPLM